MRRDDWETPAKLFDHLNRDLGFKFTVDAAASAENCLCPKFWSEKDSALEKDWFYERVFCNPPYSMCNEFVAHANNWEQANDVVLLLPVRSDRIWFQQLLHSSEWRHIWFTGRLHFGGSGKGAFMYSILFIKGFKDVAYIHDPYWDASQFNDNGKGAAQS